MVTNIKEIGKMMLDKEKELFNGLIKIYMMEIGSIIKRMDMEFIKDKMVINIKVNGKKIKSVEKGFLFGKMAIPMMDYGKIIKEMEKDYA
tara:strand:+ start:189 stop:458 length:270 start_codon:yes stop_codon:yes gene_type:complete